MQGHPIAFDSGSAGGGSPALSPKPSDDMGSVQVRPTLYSKSCVLLRSPAHQLHAWTRLRTSRLSGQQSHLIGRTSQSWRQRHNNEFFVFKERYDQDPCLLQGHPLTFDSGSEGPGSVFGSLPNSGQVTPRAGSMQGHPISFDSGSDFGSPLGSAIRTPLGSGEVTPRAGSVQGHPIGFDSGSEFGSLMGSSANSPLGSGANTPRVGPSCCSLIIRAVCDLPECEYACLWPEAES